MNEYFGSSLPVSKTVVAKCLKPIWNYSGIISGTYFSPFQGVLYLFRGLMRTPQPYLGLILEFWIIFLIFFNNSSFLDSIEWIFSWINILDFVLNWILNWIIFRPDSRQNEISKQIGQGYCSVSIAFVNLISLTDFFCQHCHSSVQWQRNISNSWFKFSSLL